MGLKIVYPPSGGEGGAFIADIVAVHGLNGDLIESWKDQETNAMWLRDFLPLDVPNTRVMSFGYNADAAFGSTTASIMDHAKDLLSSLVDKREEESEVRRPIIFLAHSVGGIAVKQALTWAKVEARYRSISDSTIGIIFFGTPHRGSETANYGAVLAKVATVILNNPTSRVLTALQTNSDELMRLTSEFRFQLGAYQVVSLYEMKPMKMMKSLVVEKQSALLEVDVEEQLPVNANHSQMCKFGSREDETYEKVYKRVRRMLNSHGVQAPAAMAENSLATIQSPNNTQRSATQTSSSSHNSPSERQDYGTAVKSSGDIRLANESDQFAKMSINPRAEKIPLVARKSFRDEWESKRPAHEDKISSLLGQKWTIDISLSNTYPNAHGDHHKSHIGSLFDSYVSAMIGQLQSYIGKYGDDGKVALNAICVTHKVTIEATKTELYRNVSCDIKDGVLRILFQDNALGVNAFQALYSIADVVNVATDPTQNGPRMSFIARQSVKQQYEARIEEVRSQVAAILQAPRLKFTPDFEHIFAELKKAKQGDPNGSYWESHLGETGFRYYKEALLGIVSAKFAKDEMSCQAFQDAIFQNEVGLRMVDKLAGQLGAVFEAVIEDGALYIQTTAKTWGVNINYIPIWNLDEIL